MSARTGNSFCTRCAAWFDVSRGCRCASDSVAVAAFVVGAALALAGAVALSGCGASVPAVIGIVELTVDATCAGAEKLCEADDPTCGSGACHAFRDVCPALDPTGPVQVTCSRQGQPAPDAGTP